jgi:hypothetical protein
VNIALLHYHLRPGGVTTVMLRQATALLEAGDRVLAVSGENPAAAEDWEGILLALAPGLRYDHHGSAVSGVEELAAALTKTLEAFHPDAVVIHNPLIRKNSSLLGAVKALAGLGFPLLLQNHDLAEDFRPDVYPDEEYPENCHYAVINSRDYGYLREAGLKAEGLHLLPNEVRPVTASPGLKKERCLYPVRAIRRKNIGEALLLSLFIADADRRSGTPPVEGRRLAITQGPVTRSDEAVYLRWKALALELGFPVEFEAGQRYSFADLLGSSFTALTTSVKEGFGFSFLEPWTAGLAVTGRRIGYVCRDFEQAGVSFEGFYDALFVPDCGATADYPRRFAAKIEETRRALYAAFGRNDAAPPHGETPSAETAGPLDFGALDEELQEDFIRKAAADKGLRDAMEQANPFLKNFASPDSAPRDALVKANRTAVLAAYSQEHAASLLRESCRAASTPVVHAISRGVLLDRFLDPARFFLTGVAGFPPERGEQR